VDLVGLEGNEIVDERARHAALNCAVFDRLFPPVDFQGLARSVLLREWQGQWDATETGRFAHSQRFHFDFGLRVKVRTGNFFPLCRSDMCVFEGL
jgi:hypothetical protein